MARKRRKNKNQRVSEFGIKYLPGATWKDVIAGKPVCKADLKSVKSDPLPFRCRECPHRTTLYPKGNVKCTKCGGVMDPIQKKKESR